MILNSWKPLEIRKFIPTEKIHEYTQALVQATAAKKGMAEGIGQSQEDCAVVSLSCRRTALALLTLWTSFWPKRSGGWGWQDLNQRCLFKAERHWQKRGWWIFVDQTDGRWLRREKNTSKATTISACCSESRVCLHSLSLICQHKLALSWRDRDWASSTGEQQWLRLIRVASQVRLMEMAEIMEHRALKCPLVLYFFFLFFLKKIFPRRLNWERLKHLEKWCIFSTRQ